MRAPHLLLPLMLAFAACTTQAPDAGEAGTETTGDGDGDGQGDGDGDTDGPGDGDGDGPGDGDGDGSGDGDGDEMGDECLEPQAAVGRTYDVELIGFAEVGPDGLFTAEGPLDYEGACILEAMSFDAGELRLELACAHEQPALPDGARVVITTAAHGEPAGLELGASLTLEAVAYESQGGDALPPGVAGLVVDVTNVQYYKLVDEQGTPVFLANVHAPTIGAGELSMILHYCDAWEACSDTGVIGGYIEAFVGGSSVEVHIGEVGTVEWEALGYDVSLFQARLDSSDCHFGIRGGVSAIRRP